ncbi:DUF934 domain-containing protein [Alsobacter sp. SYSU M60028]|uniref:DUF934 domain-containing protein n=1 Tax=Alsobacter ponti TaxID=2962936 RepID=A0ABT1L729_9HYPH|nr:DUF934 domain-containing protein [Alsobacter ponti]MCP8937245.1 DUF934 domain-containing protein [Alsobacter ponti]
MAIFRNGTVLDHDSWTVVAAGAPVPAEGDIIIALADFIAQRDALLGRVGPVGVAVEAGEELDDIVGDLPRLVLVALRFPKYTDGRSYSKARLLRERHRYGGELRAVGDVLHDQIPLMLRCGFDSLEVTHEPTLRALREGRVRGVTVHYQTSAREGREAAPNPARRWLRAS